MGICLPHAAPSSAPHVWPLKSPWCQEDDQLVCFLKECEDVLFKIGPDVNCGLIQERHCPTSADFTSNLFRHPGVQATVADEDQALGIRHLQLSLYNPHSPYSDA
jgi:hypothetical protein